MRVAAVAGLAVFAVTLTLSGCGKRPAGAARMVVSSKAQECMARAMYFESNRSSRDGMVAVGSVVMNRVVSDKFPDEVCAVVGQPRQFAPGVMTKPMGETGPRAMALDLAASVLKGERHPRVAGAMFFHQKDYRFSYDNMHYVVTAGGNAFYEKRKKELVTQPVPLPQTEGVTGVYSGAAAAPIEKATPRRRIGILSRLFGRR